MSTLPQGKPLFSVVIPTYDRPRELEACLAGLAASTFPRDRFEVIVSDDGSPRPMEPVVAPFHDRLVITLTAHRNAGPAAARNRGAARAQGTYLVFIDSDCVPAANWLTALTGQVVRTPDHLISGAIVNALPMNPFSTTTQLIVTYASEYYERRVGGDRFFNSANLAMPAARFRDLGGFDESFPHPAGEDYDFCHRWQHAGYGMTYSPEAVVYHAHGLTLAGFCRQHFGYGRGLLRCRLGIARRTGTPFRGQPLGFYLGLLRFPLAQGRNARSWLHTLLVALSQAATAAGVLWEMLAECWHMRSSRRVGGGRGSARAQR